MSVNRAFRDGQRLHGTFFTLQAYVSKCPT